MNTSLFKIFGLLAITDVIVFIGLIMTAMTDEKPTLISKVFYNTLKYVLGFPLVLLNNKFPFFLDQSEFPATGFFLIILNNLILSFFIMWCIKKITK